MHRFYLKSYLRIYTIVLLKYLGMKTRSKKGEKCSIIEYDNILSKLFSAGLESSFLKMKCKGTSRNCNGEF